MSGSNVVHVQLVPERKSFVSLPQEMVAKFLVDENVQLAAIEITFEMEDGGRNSAMLGWDGSASSTPGMIMEIPTELAACMKIKDGAEVLPTNPQLLLFPRFLSSLLHHSFA